jgi:hypothetical protein
MAFSDAIPAASTFPAHASTGDARRQETSELPDSHGVASPVGEPDRRQRATVDVGSRPGRATESATSPMRDDPILAVVVCAWPALPEAVRAGVVVIVKAAAV